MKFAAKISRAYSRLEKLPYPIQLAVFYLLLHGILIPFIPVAIFLETIGQYGPEGPKTTDILVLAVRAPLLETLIYQLLAFKFLYFIGLSKRPIWVIFLSAALFGLGHYYSLGYIFWAFTQGLVLATAYYFYLPATAKAFWSTAIIHALKNLSVLLLREALS